VRQSVGALFCMSTLRPGQEEKYMHIQVQEGSKRQEVASQTRAEHCCCIGSRRRESPTPESIALGGTFESWLNPSRRNLCKYINAYMYRSTHSTGRAKKECLACMELCIHLKLARQPGRFITMTERWSALHLSFATPLLP
jgi:hypothetical protein